MKIKNYTSTVPAAKSIQEIESLLIEVGAVNISKFYDPQTKQIQGFLFNIIINSTSIIFKMPCNEEKIFHHLQKQKPVKTQAQRQALQEQANRTAWKTLHEWTQIQITMILLEQVDPLQVFLPYAYDTATNKTLYERAREGEIKLLT